MEILDGAIYVVSEIDGDYAILTPADAPAQAPRQVALALLPDGIEDPPMNSVHRGILSVSVFRATPNSWERSTSRGREFPQE